MKMRVEVVVGGQAIRSLLSALLAKFDPSKHEMVYGLTNIDRLKLSFPELEFSTSNPERFSAATPSRLLYASEEGPIYRASDRRSLRESRYIPPEYYPFEADMTIIGDNVLFVTVEEGQEPSALLVESAAFTASMLSLFNTLWRMTENEPDTSQ